MLLFVLSLLSNFPCKYLKRANLWAGSFVYRMLAAAPTLERLPEEFKELLYAFSEASAYPCRIALID